MTLEAVRTKYTRVSKVFGKWSAYIQIDHQGFCIIEGTTKKRANWIADMAAIAIKRLLDDNACNKQ